MTTRVTPAETFPTHHVSLSDGITTLGLLLCNARGEPDGRALRESYVPRTPLRISQGEMDYSDQELPFSAATQKDWSGGRGLEDAEEDKTRYADGKGVDTSLGPILLGPKPTEIQFTASPAKQIVAQTSTFNLPNNASVGVGFSLPDSYYSYVDGYYKASRFTWTQDFPLSKVRLWLKDCATVRLVIFQYDAIDLSTVQKQWGLDAACQGLFSSDGVGRAFAGDQTGIAKTADVTIPIASAGALTAYDLPISANLLKNHAYVLSVVCVDRISKPKAVGFPFPATFGVNAGAGPARTLECWGLKGQFTYCLNGAAQIGTLVSFSDPNATPSSTTPTLAYELIASDGGACDAFFFEYRGTYFLAAAPVDGISPTELWYEGYHGFATASNSGDKYRCYLAGVGADAVGAKIKVISGAGASEETRWRTIVSVGAGYVVVDRAWYQTHDLTTEYAVMGTNKWTKITGLNPAIAKPVTSVEVVDDLVYFAQGETTPMTPIVCFNAYKNGTAWAFRTANELTDATFLKLIQNEKGERQVWRAKAAACTVASAPVTVWGAQLAFGADVVCGNKAHRITGIEAYGEPRVPWILKEDGFGSVVNGIYDQVALGEMAAVADDRNGQAHLQRGTYLFFGLLHGIERYYDNRLDDVGPNRGLGLPPSRNGYPNYLLGYPGRMYAGYDHAGGVSAPGSQDYVPGESSVLLYNEVGWHEIYRSQPGRRLRGMGVQVIPGESVDRLWIAHLGQIVWIPVAIDPRKQDDYTYQTGGELESSWIYGGFREVRKFWKSVKVFAENLEADQRYVTLAYKVDDDDASWINVPGRIEQSPVGELLLVNENGAPYVVAGRRFKWKLTLHTADPLQTPRVKAVTVDYVTRLPVKREWTLSVLASDSSVTLDGLKEENTAQQLIEQLRVWADSTTSPLPLVMRSLHGAFDDEYVFIDPASLTIKEQATLPNRTLSIVVSFRAYAA